MSQAQLEIDERGVATLTLSRPEVHNAFGAELIAELHSKLKQLREDPTIRVLVLTGAGKSFSAGADLNWMRSMIGASEQENYEDSLRLAQMLGALDEFPRPTIARVNGAAFGGGVGLVCCCDIAIASTTATLALTEVRLGIVPAVISPFVIAAIGERQARRYMQTAQRIDAQRAQELGLVHEISAPEMLDETVEQEVVRLLKAGPRALAAIKELVEIRRRYGPDSVNLQRETAQVIARLRVSDEGQEGVTAFLEKRKADFTR